MAVLEKQRARKALIVGDIGINYGNYAVIGLLETKHISVQISSPFGANDPKPSYMLRMSIPQATTVAIQMLRTVMEHSDVSLESIVTRLSAKDNLSGFQPK